MKKTVAIIGNYSIVKYYEKLFRHYYFDIMYKGERKMFTCNSERDAKKALNTWVEINGKY